MQNNKYMIKGMLIELGSLMSKVISLQSQIVNKLDNMKLDDEISPQIINTISPPVIQSSIVPLTINSTILVNSMTENGREYELDYILGTCTCPHYKYSGPLLCKHMKKVYENPIIYGLNNHDVKNLETMYSK